MESFPGNGHYLQYLWRSDVMKSQIFIIASAFIFLQFFGCEKTESPQVNSANSQQIQKVQENSSADNSIQPQPVSDNSLPKDDQTSASADNNIPAEPAQQETPEVQQDAQNTERSVVVKMVEYNEYKVMGTRMIERFPGAGGRHKRLPNKIELKVRCAIDNPEQCECIDGPDGPGPYSGVPHVVPCNRKIAEVTNVHKHGTIDSFDKLLNNVKQSPEKIQYAISFIDFMPEKEYCRVHCNAVEIRKLCPVQNGVISEDCECFSAKSHDPDSFLVTSGDLIKCPEPTK